MGQGCFCSCEKCGSQYNIFLGVGMLYPRIYEELIQSIKNGEYGLEMQEIVKSDEFVAVDAEQKLFVCEKCKDWKVDCGLDLYEPKDRVKLINQRIEELKERDKFFENVFYDLEKNELKTSDGKPVDISEINSCVALWAEEENYKLLKKYEHKCFNCGCDMREVGEDEEVELKCPECEGKMLKDNSLFVLWD